MKYKAGAQYAELSSFTSQLEQLEFARSADCTVGLKATSDVSKVLINEVGRKYMAKSSPQCNKKENRNVKKTAKNEKEGINRKDSPLPPLMLCT